MLSADRPQTRLATRLSFLVAGFGLACWAPLVPYAKDRTGVEDGVLGLLLLCLGIGSIVAMIATGALAARYGSKPVILLGGFGLALILPTLAVADTAATLGLALFVFGAALGTLDVAMNIHAVDVDRAAPEPLMSGFHALFSIGAFLGASVMTLLLSLHLSPFEATLLCVVPMGAAMVLVWPRLLTTVKTEDGPILAVPRGIVLLLAGLSAIAFLVEGAMLDWGALLIRTENLAPPAQAGLGYILFSIAMTTGRLLGDRVVARIGDGATLLGGSLIAIGGFALLLLSPFGSVALAGFVLIGLGASNLVPVLFRGAGTQTAMPVGLAVAAITTMGYAGILVGPAGVGFVADSLGLKTAFWGLAGLVGIVALCARAATSDARALERRVAE
ncbi:MFS transporter [Magnetospirillum fulvum]|uniref:Putative transport protein n=1 Tax=Magnetospirillum fulvum MGU-K5 TaxID=1316936 RepID=S9TQ42_MAGFU|nr:MFS transporter [Magnetospirillum fulvum]EPY00645.1 putative transport protein [Magnetospirillum fulvum MGU-K5]